tara:strand:- start:406 stop:579 length:174 start_codon:yes stop_codon:yes gene_type:complete
MWALILPVAKSVVLKAVKSDQVKDLVIEILKKLVAQTDNDIDDLLVAKLEKALFPKK